jgi:hypothetical protein
MAIGVGMMAASMLVSAVGSQKQAEAQASALNQQARIAQNQAQVQQAEAKAAQDKAAADAAMAERQANAVSGREQALSGASGAMGDSGTFIDLLSSSDRNEARDVYNIDINGQQNAAIYNANATNLMYTADGYRAQAAQLPGLAMMKTISGALMQGGSMLVGGGMGGGAGAAASSSYTGDAAASSMYGSARPAYSPDIGTTYTGWVPGGV